MTIVFDNKTTKVLLFFLAFMVGWKKLSVGKGGLALAKLKSGRTITIKINGEQEPFVEESVQPNDNPSNETKVQEENQSEPVTQEGPGQTAASKEPAEESFDWILPEPSEAVQAERIEVNQAVVSQAKKSKFSSATKNTAPKNNTALRSIILAVIFAVLVGTSFGILMLKLVIMDHGKPQALPKTPASVTATTPAQTQTGAAATTAVLKPLNLFVVQKGVFSTKEAVKTVSNQVTVKGLPADTLEVSGKYYLFVGVADSIEDARSLGNFYRTNGTADIYPKNLAIPEKKVSNLNSDEKNLLESAVELFTTLAKATSSGLIKAAIPSETVKTINSMAAGITKLDNKQIQNGKVKDLKSEISAAAELAGAFQKSADENMLLKAQQHLLTFLSLYNAI